MNAPICFKTWRVSGLRDLGAGSTAQLTASSFGPTEERARKTFHRLFNKGTGEGTAGERLVWADHELTFSEEGGAL